MEHLLKTMPTSMITTVEDLGSKDLDCANHGPYITHGMRYMGKREVWSKCPDCKEAELAAERMAEAIKKSEADRVRIEKLLNQAAIPKRFIGRTLDNFNAAGKGENAALAIAKMFVVDFQNIQRRGDGLVFSGLPGTGKSHLATAILQALMPEHCGLYVTCMGLIRAVRETWRKDSPKSENEVLNEIAGVPLLVLDEIGVQYGTDGEQTILFEVLDRRYRNMMPTILLTNQDKKGLKEFIGERSFDRLTETSKWVSFDWGSYRAQARREST